MSAKGHLGPAAVDRVVNEGIRGKRRELYRRWGCEGWKNWAAVAQLPVWLLVVETVRGMCGTHKGLLGLIFTTSEGEGAAAGTAASADAGAAAGSVPEVLETVMSVDVAPPVTTSEDALAAVPWARFEPSMATEGMLWFPDLTAPDPLLALPFMLSATLFLNIYSRAGNSGVAYIDMSPSAKRWTRALGVGALAIGPLMLQMPSGVLLYWVSSSMMGYVQGVLIEKYMPLTKPVKPCKKRAFRMITFMKPSNVKSK
jgi:inner membrane protein COX18